MNTRRYDNSKREAKANATRKRIIDALISQLTQNNSADFSVEEAALAAGVTVRTIFRHFATKEEMLVAVSEGISEVTGKVTRPKGPEDLLRTMNQSYLLFEDNEDLIKATLLSQLGRGVRSKLAQARRINNMASLDELVETLPAEQANAVKGVMCQLITAENWLNLKENFAVPGHDAAQVIEWILNLAFNALKNGDVPQFDDVPTDNNRENM